MKVRKCVWDRHSEYVDYGDLDHMLTPEIGHKQEERRKNVR